MGQTHVDVTFSNPENPAKKIKVSGLVDTGANISIIPRSLADELGLKPKGHVPVHTVNGMVQLDFTFLNTKINGAESPFMALINPTLNKVVIGLVVLETFGYKVNPTSQKLEKVILEEY